MITFTPEQSTDVATGGNRTEAGRHRNVGGAQSEARARHRNTLRWGFDKE